MSFETCLQGQIPFCYTCGLVSAGATYLYCATLWHVVTHGTYELSVWYNLSFAGPIYHNALTSCAALSCRALRRVNRLCSRTVSDTANMSRHGSTLCSPTVEKILCRSPFRSGHMSAICARLSQKEVGVKRVETLVSTLLPRRGARHAPAVRRRRIPSLRFSEKTPRPLGANTLTQFEYPAQPVQKRLPPG